jgi:hypothetical protein
MKIWLWERVHPPCMWIDTHYFIGKEETHAG